MNGDSLKEIIGLAYDYQIELSEESDRGAAILAAANFEEWLGSIISGYFAKIGYPLRSPIRSRSVLKTHKKTPMYGLISTHSYRIGNKGKFHNHES